MASVRRTFSCCLAARLGGLEAWVWSLVDSDCDDVLMNWRKGRGVILGAGLWMEQCRFDVDNDTNELGKKEKGTGFLGFSSGGSPSSL